MPEPQNPSSASAVIAAALAIGDVRKTSAGREFVVVPRDAELRSLDEFREKPARQRAEVHVTEIDSFVRYVKTFAGAHARIFASIDKVTGAAAFVAVLDYHEGKEGPAGWGQHKTTYTATQTPEWKTWVQGNKKACSQREFASFIEDNLDDIREPNGAQMLEIAKTLETKTSVEFKSGIRLENGDHQLKYVAETTGRAGGNGDLDIPALFALGIAPFDGGPAYKVSARLRYRIADGHLTLWYELVNPHKVIDAACKEIVDVITKETDMVPFIGPAPRLTA